MDTLTFLLDRFTPFWRTYGKTIGDDIQDFLIIPLYRNEFTGEAKRYPITKLPERSVRHWFALLAIFYGLIGLSLLQARAALFSTTHHRLGVIEYEEIRWVVLPFFWISIIIQWGAVVTELLLVVTEVCVLFWWLGWSVRLFS